MHRIVSGKVPPYLTAKCSLSQSQHCGKVNIPIPRIDLFKSSLVYSGSVLWHSFHDSPRLQYSTETFKSRYMPCIMHWLGVLASMLNVLSDCVSHSLRILPTSKSATDDFKALRTHPHSRLPHIMFDVSNFIYSMCVPVSRSLEHVYTYN